MKEEVALPETCQPLYKDLVARLFLFYNNCHHRNKHSLQKCESCEERVFQNKEHKDTSLLKSGFKPANQV